MSASDDIADMLLSSFVDCVEKLVKLLAGLATEHRQQLLVLCERYHLRADGLSLFLAENLGLVQFTDKSGMLGIQSVHQEHVMLLDSSRVNISVIEI